MTVDRDVLGVRDVAEYLGVCRQTVLRRIKEGTIPAMRNGRLWLVRRADLHALFSQPGRLNGGARLSDEDVLQILAPLWTAGRFYALTENYNRGDVKRDAGAKARAAIEQTRALLAAAGFEPN